MSPNSGELVTSGFEADMRECQEKRRQDSERGAVYWLRELFHHGDEGRVLYVREGGQIVRLTLANQERWLREVNARRDMRLGTSFRFKLPTAESMTAAFLPGVADARRVRRMREKGSALQALLGIANSLPFLPR